MSLTNCYAYFKYKALCLSIKHWSEYTNITKYYSKLQSLPVRKTSKKY